MTTIQLTFPWGRYYAHPWGINPTRLREPEWPPSPWRLLRALVSAWFRAHPGQPPSKACKELIESLGRELPDIGFGKVSFGQTVHWQPNYGAASKEDKADAAYKNTRHENHFSAVHGPVFFMWRDGIPPEQLPLLKTLLAELTYFGRAESICHAEVCDTEPGEATGWCKDTGGRKISATCRDVFCPKPDDFLFTDLWMRRNDVPNYDTNNAPPHFVDTLLSSTMKADGAEWRSYEMPKDWPKDRLVRIPRTAKPVNKPAPGEGPKVANYLCFSLECRVPLPPKFIVPLSEKFRAAANSHLCKVHGEGAISFALLGHERPPDVVGDHQHAFYLPMAKPGDASGHLSDLHVWCPYGFTQEEVNILLRIQRLNWGSGKYPVRPVLTALCKEPPSEAPFSTGQIAACLWRSASPFVPPRYFYRGSGRKIQVKEKDRPDLQLVECLERCGAPTPSCIRSYLLVDGVMQNDNHLWEIVRTEIGEQSAAGTPLVTVPTHTNGSSGRKGMEQRIGGFFEIEFSDPVALKQPALGHSCHFGLGLFVPVEA